MWREVLLGLGERTYTKRISTNNKWLRPVPVFPLVKKDANKEDLSTTSARSSKIQA
jgi:hypothetical protein